jgi:hypothetical protein
MICTDPQLTTDTKASEKQCLDRESETFFSTLDFAEAWSVTSNGSCRTLPLPVKGSGPPRTMYAVEDVGYFGRQAISLGPFNLYGSPGWQGRLEQSTLQDLLRRLKTIRSDSFIWNVRFDQEPLAAGLASLGLNFQRTDTQVLDLSPGYEPVFAGFSSTTRNHIRKARRRGVLVRPTHSAEDVRKYYEIHLRLVEQKGGYSSVLPLQFLQRLIQCPGKAHFLVAEYEEQMVGGALFLRDGCSIFYLHGASDRDYSQFFPTCAIFDEAIRWACCETGAAFFNFGGSGAITSLAKFKASWGARQELNWRFQWTNPFWARLSRFKRALSAKVKDNKS